MLGMSSHGDICLTLHVSRLQGQNLQVTQCTVCTAPSLQI